MDRLNDIQIRHWIKAGNPVAKAQGEVPGLTFTLSAKGTVSWVLRYRYGGRPREFTIGRYPEYSIKHAKEEALEARAKVQKGIDVASAVTKSFCDARIISCGLSFSILSIGFLSSPDS